MVFQIILIIGLIYNGEFLNDDKAGTKPFNDTVYICN